MSRLNKQFREVAEALGREYSLIYIDCTWSIYRDLMNGFDVEIINVNSKNKQLNLTVYVWQIRDKLMVIETIEGIGSIDELNKVLTGIINRTNWIAKGKMKAYKPLTRVIG